MGGVLLHLVSAEGDTEGWSLCEGQCEDSYSQPLRGSQEAVQLGRTPDTNCIRGLESRHCGPCTWSNSPNGTVERWEWRKGLLRRGPVPRFPLIRSSQGTPTAQHLEDLCPILFQCQEPLPLCLLPSSPEPGSQHPSSHEPRDSHCLSQGFPAFSSVGIMPPPHQPPSPYHPNTHVWSRRLEHKGGHLVGHQIPTGPATVPTSHQQDTATKHSCHM